jgi:TPR repeat protein
MTTDQLVRDKYMDAALSGDAEAQYRVGLAYCCAPRNNVDAFYNNRKATEFLCLAARQSHPDAAFELGNFHSGDRVDGVRWIRRTANLIRGDGLENRPVAYYWYSQAKSHGNTDAAQRMQELGVQDITRFSTPITTPCTVDEVYGGT